MAIPEGYEKLAVVGIAWKGDYAEGTAYKAMNGIYYEGSTYVALRDNPTGPPSADGTNWQYLAKGFVAALLSMITAIDTSGVLGEAGAEVGAQLLMDSIADKVMTKLLAKNQIVNNLLATEPGNVLDAMQGMALKEDIDRVNSDLVLINTAVSEASLDTIKATYFPSKNYPISYQGTTEGGNMIEGSIYSAGIEIQRRTYWETKSTQIRTKASGAWSGWINYVTNSDFGKTVNTENLNDVIVLGDYAQCISNNATLARNYPITKAGLLEVRIFAGGGWIYQRYTTFEGFIYNRRKYNGTWNAWVKI